MKAEVLTKNGFIEVDLNRRKAIKLKCLDCSGFEYAEVRDCDYKDCSLLQFRTGKGNQNPVERDKAIRAYCMWCTLDQPKEISLCDSYDCPLHQFRGYNRVKKKPDSTKRYHLGAFPDMISHQPYLSITQERIPLPKGYI